MTIEQLDAVPIGGKVKTILHETWRRVHEKQWVKEEVFATHDLIRQWAYQEAINDPVDYAQPEPQTWQDAARAQGWIEVGHGTSHFRRLTKHGSVFEIRNTRRGYTILDIGKGLCFESRDGFAVLAKSAEYASVHGGWA